MEQNACKELSKIASDFKCEKVLETVDESIVCPTPQKNEEPLTVKSREGQTNLPEKKFSHAHLAQMKYILPKSVCIDRVLVHDKKSLCMVPDMKITLKFEVVEDCSGESADLALRRYFKSKLIDFFDMHPEDMPTQKSTSSYKPGKRVLDFSLMEDNDGLGIEVDKLESIRALHGSIR
ncbi:CDT1-like protein a, chloroplastic [Glycine soja]